MLLHGLRPLRPQRLPHATLVDRRRDATAGAGGGAQRACARRSTSTGVEALGWVDDDEKLAQLGAAEVVCAPSLTAESFGIVLAEAMAAGVPVVASDLPGYRSVLRDGAAGTAGAARASPPRWPRRWSSCCSDAGERRAARAAGMAAADGAVLGARHGQRRRAPTRTRSSRRERRGTACPAARGSAAAMLEYAGWCAPAAPHGAGDWHVLGRRGPRRRSGRGAG